MSKAVLGNTLTTEASKTGTQALGTVHNKVELELIEQDALSILNLLNYDMTEQFAALGINTQEEVAGKRPKNRARSFFGHAPQTDGALDW